MLAKFKRSSADQICRFDKFQVLDTKNRAPIRFNLKPWAERRYKQSGIEIWKQIKYGSKFEIKIDRKEILNGFL